MTKKKMKKKMKKMIRRMPRVVVKDRKHRPYRIDLDTGADTVYITLRDGGSTKTFEFSDELKIDLDSKNNIIGIEILRGEP